MKRWEFERAVMASSLPAPSRLILLVLAAVADWPGGRVPVKYSPSLTTLAERTGLSRRAVADHLNEIERAPEHDLRRDGWVCRRRPTKENARSKKERTQYQLSIPASAGDALAAHPEVPPTSAGDALASAGGALELVQEVHWASAGGAHNQASSKSSSSSSSPTVTRIAAALGEEEEEARQIYNRVIAARRPAAPSRYVDTLIATGDIAQFRTPPARTNGAAVVPTHPFLEARGGECGTCGLPRTHARHGGQP